MVLALILAGALGWTGLGVPASGAVSAAPGRLSGRVVDAGGVAVAGAAVTATASASGGGAGSAQSDSGGAFSLAAPQGTYDLAVSAAGHNPPLQGRLRGVAIGADSHLTVVLVPAAGAAGGGPVQATLSGIVRDGSGHPLSGTSVSLFNPNLPTGPLAPGYRYTSAGADGSFSISVPPAHYQLSLSRRSSGAVDQSYVLNGSDLDVTTTRRVDFTVPVTTVTVTVRAQSGAAVPGALVSAATGNGSGTDTPITIAPGVVAQPYWSGSGPSDANGRVVFSGLPTQTLGVSAQPSGGGLAWVYRTGVRADGDSTVDLVAPPAATLHGIATDYDGSPLAGATVRLSGPASLSASTVTAADGSYSLTAPPGNWTLNLSYGTQYTADVPNRYFVVNQPIQTDGVSQQDLHLAGIRVPFHVTDPSGAPAAGAAVTVYNSYWSATTSLFPGAPGQGLRGGTVATDAAGNATIVVFDGESAFVGAQPPAGSTFAGSLGQTQTLTTSSNVSLVLRPTVVVSGVVHATPAKGFTVSVNGAAPGSALSQITGADGAYRLRVPPGPNSISISSSGQTQATSDRPEHFALNSSSFDVSADTTQDVTPGFAHVTVTAYDSTGAALTLDSVPYGNFGSTKGLPLGPGLTTSYEYFDGTGVALSSTSARLAVLPSNSFFVNAAIHNGNPGTVSAAGIVVDGDTDVALVAASDPSGTGPTTTTTTTTPPATTPTTQPPATTPPPSPVTGSPATGGDSPHGTVRSGYWALGADGRVYPFGDAAILGDPSALLGGATAVHLEPTPTGNGYWVVDSQGRVYTYGDAADHGRTDPGRLDKGETVTSLSTTPTGRGYWIFTTRGRVLPFGDAAFHGDMSAIRLNAPVVDSRPTPSGQGYYMVAADGGIFTFGDAGFHGSMGGKRLNAPVRSLVPDPDGTGYWLVASDGGIFAFDAGFRGSMGGQHLNRPVSGMVPYGDGYLMVAEDGGVFDFSNRPFSGSLGAHPPVHPVISVGVLPA
jgi:protocatechuate 3,4-dioxygenase beta subunit